MLVFDKYFILYPIIRKETMWYIDFECFNSDVLSQPVLKCYRLLINSQFDGTENYFLVSDMIPFSGLQYIKIDETQCSCYIFPQNISLRWSKLYLGIN